MPYMGFEAMRIVGWIYTLVVVGGAVWLARRVRPEGREPVIWLAILVLATMRSPFMATYAFFPVMWLAVLVAPLAWRESRRPGPCSSAGACWRWASVPRASRRRGTRSGRRSRPGSPRPAGRCPLAAAVTDCCPWTGRGRGSGAGLTLTWSTCDVDG